MGGGTPFPVFSMLPVFSAFLGCPAFPAPPGCGRRGSGPAYRSHAVSSLERLAVRALVASDRARTLATLVARWGSTRVVARGRLVDASTLSGLVAWRASERIGVLTWQDDGGEREIVTVDAILPRRGIGRALVRSLLEDAATRYRAVVVVVTTNDNQPAQRFYEALGFVRTAVRRGAVDAARRLKPEIPLHGVGGERIRDEIEYRRAPRSGDD